MPNPCGCRGSSDAGQVRMSIRGPQHAAHGWGVVRLLLPSLAERLSQPLLKLPQRFIRIHRNLNTLVVQRPFQRNVRMETIAMCGRARSAGSAAGLSGVPRSFAIRAAAATSRT